MTRAEHVAYCKARALAYLDHGDVHQAFASLSSDLQKHPETVGHSALRLGMMEFMAGHLATAGSMREFIEGIQ
jgi:hypothetical protein